MVTLDVTFSLKNLKKNWLALHKLKTAVSVSVNWNQTIFVFKSIMADVGEMPRSSAPHLCLHCLPIDLLACFPVTLLIDNGLITCLSCYFGNDVSENKHDISLF